MVPKNNKNTKTAISYEVLTDAAMNRLADGVFVYYNCDTDSWNTNTYNGYTINNQHKDAATARLFRAVLEKIPEFNSQYDFVAPVTMTISSRTLDAHKQLIKNPKYNKRGTTVVGNIVVRDKHTGKLELYGKYWCHGGHYHTAYAAANNGTNGFAYYGATNPDFQAALIAAHNGR